MTVLLDYMLEVFIEAFLEFRLNAYSKLIPYL